MNNKPQFVRQQIRLEACDVQETLAFYRDVLGFSVDSTWGPAAAPNGCILDRDDVHLLFDRADGSEPQMSGVIVIEVQGLSSLFEHVKDRAEVLWGPEVYGYGMREFAIEDNNGYRIAFCERTDDPPTCEGRGKSELGSRARA